MLLMLSILLVYINAHFSGRLGTQFFDLTKRIFRLQVTGDLIAIKINKIIPFLIPVLHHPSWVRKSKNFVKKPIFLIDLLQIVMVLTSSQGKSNFCVCPKTDLLFEPLNKLRFILFY